MHVIAVDVGTTSVRLAIIHFGGQELNQVSVSSNTKKEIDHIQNGCKFEQKSEQIWKAICDCSRKCIQQSNIDIDSIEAIAFSSTCSLVVVDSDIGDVDDKQHNDIIMWMDHRAIQEAQLVTDSGSKVLEQFGGTCSPEFSLSKLMWLEKNDPKRFKSAASFFELPDWLVYKCIRCKPDLCPRSTCSQVCKWGYNTETGVYCDFLKSLFDKDESFYKINGPILKPGTISGYLSTEAAIELGLSKYSKLCNEYEQRNFKSTHISVGTSLIDAHSGMLAMSAIGLGHLKQNIDSIFCSLTGTSSCHMLLSKVPNFTKGIWGPYKDVILEDYHLLEAGQSMTGKLIEICIESHEEGRRRMSLGQSVYSIINELNEELLEKDFESSLHVLPSYHGNRSPFANPRLRGGIYGLSSGGTKSLLDYYVATVDSIVYETKLIIDRLDTKLNSMIVSGGLMKNTYYMKTLSDVLQCPTMAIGISNIDLMVLGSGLVARHAAIQSSKNRSSFDKSDPLTDVSIKGLGFQNLKIKVYEPDKKKMSYHDKRYECYKEFVYLSQKIDKILTQSSIN